MSLIEVDPAGAQLSSDVMAAASDPGFLVLHALRLKGFADTSVVAALTRLTEDEAAAYLEKSASAGHATRREGRISGWALTAEGRSKHAEQIATELDDTGERAAVEDAYRRFKEINAELLTVCTDWQLRGGLVNDHGDSDYDAAVIKRLGDVDAAVQPICDDLARALARFESYGPRFASALERVQAGDHEWFARPMIDSYHTVWFELHEDLLVTLGIQRSKEGGS